MEAPDSIEELQEAIQTLVGMPVSLPWQGCGSAICLELGDLSPPRTGLHMEHGESSIFVEWDWRVENGAVVSFGSSEARPRIKQGIDGLRGTTVVSVSVVGKVPELEVGFSSGELLRTMVMIAGRPQWHVRLPNDRYISPDDLVAEGKHGDAIRAEWEEAHDLWRHTARRWGEPIAEPRNGRCEDCLWFVRLDGEGYLVEYGVCGSSRSPLDGRVVKCSSGCPAFTKPRGLPDA